MQKLTKLLTNKRFLSFLIVATGLLGVTFASHAVLHNTTYTPSENPVLKAALEFEGELSGDMEERRLLLEKSAGSYAPEMPDDGNSNKIGTFKKNHIGTLFDNPSVWMADFTNESDYNKSSPSIDYGKRPRVSVTTSVDNPGTPEVQKSTIVSMNFLQLDHDLDFGMGNQTSAAELNPAKNPSPGELAATGTAPSPAPEPSTMFLVGSGLVGLALLARKNFKR